MAAPAVALSLFLLAPLCESFSSVRKVGYASVDLSVSLNNATQSIDLNHATQGFALLNSATQSVVLENATPGPTLSSAKQHGVVPENTTQSVVPMQKNATQSLVLLKKKATQSVVLDNATQSVVLNNSTRTVVDYGPMGFALVQLQAFWREDVFDNPTLEPAQVLHMIFQHKTDWLILAIATVLLVAFDSFVLRPLSADNGCEAATEGGSRCNSVEDAAEDMHPTSGKTSSPGRSTWVNLAALGFWIAMAIVYMGIVWARRGEEAAVQWCTGYLLEWLLSLDNLFVFHLIFRTYGTPKEMVHKALFLGILGAVVFRMLFFMVLTSLLHLVKWVRLVFGLLLIYSGIEAARSDDDDADVTDTFVVKCLKQCLGSRLVESYDTKDHALFVKGKDGERKATLLVFVIICLELTDIFFAIDSVSAKVAQIPNFYIAYSSSILAIFGLRAMFFLIQDMVDAFDLLKYGLCFILVFIGVELMLADWVQLPAQVVCAVILSVFFLGIGGSLAQHYMSRSKKSQEGARDPSSVA